MEASNNTDGNVKGWRRHLQPFLRLRNAGFRQDADRMETKPVWFYIIFRKNYCVRAGKSKISVNISCDGPIFWNRQVAYVYNCSCHFGENEIQLLSLLRKFEKRIERVCLVDKPVNYPFLPDHFFSYMVENLHSLQFIYLRQLNLENINRATAVKLADHDNLKKVIVHGCKNFEVLEDFHTLPQLLVVTGEIQGIKFMLNDLDLFDENIEATTSISANSTADGQIETSEC